MARIKNLYAGRVATVVGLTLVATLGLVTGVIFAYSPDLAIIAELDDYSPGTITRIHARDGQLIGEYATERRMILTYDEIPEVLRHAIIAAEDGDFFSHAGFNIPRIVMTLLSNILEGDLTAAGASTITMQLARNVTLGGRSLGLEKTLQRKIVEAFYTLHIEKRYTKREILTLYANQIWLGTARHSAFGVEAASRLYFDRPAAELALGEAATIAGTIQRPAQHSPLVNMDMALNRRDYTLQRMIDDGHVSQTEADAVMAQPIVLAERTERSNSIAPYFIEEVRQHLEQEYGVARLYEEGLTVHTTLDVRLQQAANRAVDAGLRAHDKRRGFRPPARNVLAEAAGNGDAREPAEVLAAYEHYRWRLPMRAGDIVPALVTATGRGRKRNWNRSRWRRPRCSPSRTGPAAFSRWWAATTSVAASSIARRRPTGSSARSSRACCTRRRSTRGTPPRRSCRTNGSATTWDRDSRSTPPPTTITPTRARSRCGGRWRSRATSPPCGS